MSNATLHEDGLDVCYQMTEIPVRQRAMPSFKTVLRGAMCSLLVASALGIGLLAMQPGGLPVDKFLNALVGGAPTQSGCRAGACCSELQLEIPGAMPSDESTGPMSDQLVGDDVVSTNVDDSTDL